MATQEPNPDSPFRKPPAPPQPAVQRASTSQEQKTEQQERPATSTHRFAFTPMHGLLAVGVLLLGAILWYGIAKQAGSSTSSPSPSAPAPVVGRLSASERQAATEALSSLQALQSVTTAGITYGNYAPRVLDAKIRIDRFLQSDGGDPTIKRIVQEAMALYVLASSAWNAKITERWDDVVDDPRFGLCPPVKRDIDEVQADEYLSRETRQRIRMVNSVPGLWECASGKIAEIEQTLKKN